MTSPLEAKVEFVTQCWINLLPFQPPDKYTVNRWLLEHGSETVIAAIKEVVLKRAKLNNDMERSHALRLTGAICCSVRRLKKHQQNAA